MISATFDAPTEVRHIIGKSFLVENARMSTKKRVMPRQVLHLWFSGVAVQKRDRSACTRRNCGSSLLPFVPACVPPFFGS